MPRCIRISLCCADVTGQL